MQALDLDGDGDIDAEEWARGKALIEAQAPGVPNPAVWYATMPGDEAFRITQSGGFGEMTASESKNERTEYRDEVGGESATRSRPRCPSPFHLSLSLSHTHMRVPNARRHGRLHGARAASARQGGRLAAR